MSSGCRCRFFADSVHVDLVVHVSVFTVFVGAVDVGGLGASGCGDGCVVFDAVVVAAVCVMVYGVTLFVRPLARFLVCSRAHAFGRSFVLVFLFVCWFV